MLQKWRKWRRLTDEQTASLLKILARELVLLESSDCMPRSVPGRRGLRKCGSIRSDWRDFRKVLALLEKSAAGQALTETEREPGGQISARDSLFPND